LFPIAEAVSKERCQCNLFTESESKAGISLGINQRIEVGRNFSLWPCLSVHQDFDEWDIVDLGAVKK
jgi:hypothetical protein